MPSQIPIYYFDTQGRFNASRLDLAAPLYTSPISVQQPCGVQVSSNGRYLAYSDMLSDRHEVVLMMYDVRTRSERRLHVFPQYVATEIEFSPNSDWLALLVAGYPHGESLSKEGVYLYPTAGGKTKFFHYPRLGKLTQSEVMGTGLKWSADGHWLFLAFNNSSDREYHRLNPLNGAYHTIDGDYVNGQYIFMNRTAPVPLHENQETGSTVLHMDLLSHNQQYRATVDKSLRLRVTGVGLTPRTLANGELRPGTGDITPLFIRGWVENRYLIYSNQNRTHIYDVITKSHYPLFDQPGIHFTWFDGHRDNGIRPAKSNAAPSVFCFTRHRLLWSQRKAF